MPKKNMFADSDSESADEDMGIYQNTRRKRKNSITIIDDEDDGADDVTCAQLSEEDYCRGIIPENTYKSALHNTLFFKTKYENKLLGAYPSGLNKKKINKLNENLLNCKKKLSNEIQKLRDTNLAEYNTLCKKVLQLNESDPDEADDSDNESTDSYYKSERKCRKHKKPKKELSAEETYFKNKMTYLEQTASIDSLKNIIKLKHNGNKPDRIHILQLAVSDHIKHIALIKLDNLASMDSSDYHKYSEWIKTFIKIPFGIYTGVRLRLEDGVEKTAEFLENSRTILDACTYGMKSSKEQFITLLGKWISSPLSIGTSIGIHGPAGTGKTTLMRDGVSQIMGREFAFIALGGIQDSAYLVGHSFTYIGSTYGKILNILLQCKTMNPIIFFDELDKISDTPKGDEIIGILTHLTDTSQNSEFEDKYFAGIPLDLSKCLFVFSFNDETKINRILKDRMYCIKTEGYGVTDKLHILRDYLIPACLRDINFRESEVLFSDATILYIIENYYVGDSGARNLKRCIETILKKINVVRLMGKHTYQFDINFPLSVTSKMVDAFLTELRVNGGACDNEKHRYAHMYT